MNHPEVTAAHREAAARVLEYYTDQPLADRIALAIAYAERRGVQQPSPPELQELLLRDWAVRTLDAWRMRGILRRWRMTEGISTSAPICRLSSDSNPGATDYSGDTEDAARLSAATAMWPSLPADVQAKIGARQNG